MLSKILFGILCVSAPLATGLAGQFDVDRVDGSTIYFKAPDGAGAPNPYASGLFDLINIGTLRHPTGTSYFLFAGRSCQTCVDEKNLYFIQPGQAGKPSTSRPIVFVYPGKIFDPKSRRLMLESRAFYGRCLPGHGDTYVVYQRELIDRRRHLQESVLLVEPGPDHLSENLIERHLPRIKNTLRLVKSKACHEIEGRNRLMASKALNIHPHAAEDESEDDEDTPTKENQTDRDMAPPSPTPSAATSPTPSAASAPAPGASPAAKAP